MTVGAASGVSSVLDSSSFKCFLPSGPSPLGSGSGTEVGSDMGLVGDSLASSQFLKLVLSLGGELTSFKVALLLNSFLGGRLWGNSCGGDLGTSLLSLSVGGTTESMGSSTVTVDTGCEDWVLGLGEVREALGFLPLRALTGGETFSWFSVFPLLDVGLPLFLPDLAGVGVFSGGTGGGLDMAVAGLLGVDVLLSLGWLFCSTSIAAVFSRLDALIPFLSCFFRVSEANSISGPSRITALSTSESPNKVYRLK